MIFFPLVIFLLAIQTVCLVKITRVSILNEKILKFEASKRQIFSDHKPKAL